MEVPGLSFNRDKLGIRQEFDVLVSSGIDHLGCFDTHRAIVGREGLVQLGHLPTDRGLAVHQVDLDARGGKVQRRRKY